MATNLRERLVTRQQEKAITKPLSFPDRHGNLWILQRQAVVIDDCLHPQYSIKLDSIKITSSILLLKIKRAECSKCTRSSLKDLNCYTFTAASCF